MNKLVTTLLAVVFSTTVMAGNVAVNTGENDLAIKGYDTVAYFTQGKAVEGQANFTAKYEGATYQFSSAENRDMFVSNPAKYAPQYGGFCAYGVSKGRKYDTDPTAFKIVDDKLYLNYNAKVQEIWSADQSALLEQSEMNWTRIEAKTDAELAAAEDE